MTLMIVSGDPRWILFPIIIYITGLPSHSTMCSRQIPASRRVHVTGEEAKAISL